MTMGPASTLEFRSTLRELGAGVGMAQTPTVHNRLTTMATASAPGAGLRNFSVLYSSEPESISDEHIQPDGDRHAPSATSALVRSPSN